MHRTMLALSQCSVFALIAIAMTHGVQPLLSEDTPWDAPEIRVASPLNRVGYVVGSRVEGKSLICIEVTDRSGTGIERTHGGDIRFVDSNHNVDVFLSYVVAEGSYVNKLGQETHQLCSAVPVDKLEFAEGLTTPPIDYKRIRPSSGQYEFMPSAESMVQFASFQFQVKDLRGTRSVGDESVIILGFTDSLWVPSPEEILPPSEGKLSEGQSGSTKRH